MTVEYADIFDIEGAFDRIFKDCVKEIGDGDGEYIETITYLDDDGNEVAKIGRF